MYNIVVLVYVRHEALVHAIYVVGTVDLGDNCFPVTTVHPFVRYAATGVGRAGVVLADTIGRPQRFYEFVVGNVLSDVLRRPGSVRVVPLHGHNNVGVRRKLEFAQGRLDSVLHDQFKRFDVHFLCGRANTYSDF
jgi:hypothetical protein